MYLGRVFRKPVNSKGPGKRGHIVADTMLLMMFLGLRKLGNICCGHKMFLNKIRNIFCVPDTKFLSATDVARSGKRGNICVGNNVSATMFPSCQGLNSGLKVNQGNNFSCIKVLSLAYLLCSLRLLMLKTEGQKIQKVLANPGLA